VEEQAGSVDLRQLLNETALSQAERVSFAKRLGKWLAEYHNLGFTTPELAAKHVLINRAERKFTLIDWQSALRVPFVSLEDRLRALAALHASLAEPLASTRERLRVLWEALRTYREEGLIEERFSEIVRRVVREANRLLKRRSIRDQRQSTPPVSQRLIWVAGEAVCAVPDVASTWPTPAIASPFYGCEPGRETVQLPDGCDAILIRGRSFSPLGRLRAWFRGKSWRSQGVTLGRLLFHLERYGIAAPRLLAFGQRFTGRTTAEWFALHTLPAEAITVLPDSAIALQLGRMLRQLHDAGCSVGDKPLTIFGLDCSVVCIRDPMAVRIAKPNAERELRSFLAALPHGVRKHAKLGYRTEQQPIRQDKTTRATKTVNRLPLADVT
jgi:tRNA A-37 threonylcarbamoyl transferase component Bud32